MTKASGLKPPPENCTGAPVDPNGWLRVASQLSVVHAACT
eukprot:CAMPEP_0198496594 /NCGR_PEP_ID=MMETSP1462-20131121/5937_1 /TAXON_ID=1333877 /ORGANISM="Brandtodinium nutriculum, Strain RCC3387" /LENGTH=39 /DNA_ID= /DNA_START= /DNA_END= /DNA_ORIENTATION=